MKKLLKVTVILMALGVLLSSCCPCPPDETETPPIEVGSGCVDFQDQGYQTFPGPDFTITPLLFINPTDPQGTPIELKIDDFDNDGIFELIVGSSSSDPAYGWNAMQVFFLSESIPNGVDIASVTLMHGAHADIIALADDGSQQDVASAPSQAVLTTLIVEGGSEPIRSMVWEMEEAYVYEVCWGEEAVMQSLTPESEPTAIHITFNELPDGTPVTTDLFLEGDEFLTQGVTLAGAPGGLDEPGDPSYCADAIAVAIHRPDEYEGQNNFLTPVRPGEIEICNTIPIEITFTSPVRKVTLTFFGASTTYKLHAYDSTGTLLGTEQKDAVYQGGTFEITFSTGSSNIGRIVFGHTAALAAITEISYLP